MKERVIERLVGWQIASAPSRIGNGFVSWAKMGPIQGASPLSEPGAHVWFNFGATRAEAVQNIKRELGIDS